MGVHNTFIRDTVDLEYLLVFEENKSQLNTTSSSELSGSAEYLEHQLN